MFWQNVGNNIAVNSGDQQLEEFLPNFETESEALYGQATKELLPGTNLTLGARYTIDHKFDHTPLIAGGALAADSYQSDTWRNPTYRVALDHSFTGNLMAYLSFNTGFKSGSYSEAAIDAPAANPETLKAWELGSKSEWLDHRLRVNGSMYYYQYHDLQVQEIVSTPYPTSYVLNAAKAEVKGLDLDVTTIPIEHLELDGGLSMLDGHYTSYDNGLHYSPAPTNTCANVPFPATSPGGLNLVAGCNLSGNQMVFAPPRTFDVSATYTIPSSLGEWDLSTLYTYSSRYYFTPDNTIYSPSRGLVNAAVQWIAPSKRWDIRVWGKNLGNKQYYTYEQVSSFAAYSQGTGAPLTYGVSLGVHLK